MSKKGYKKPTNQLESNENQYKDDESEIPYRRSLIIQQFNDFKLIIKNQEEQLKEAKNEIKSKNEQIENEIRMRNNLNSKIFDYEKKINDLETINIFQKNEIDKKDKKIKLLNQEIFNLKSKKIPSNDFIDQEAKDTIDHLSKELDEKDLEIMKLNTKIQSLLNGKNIKEKQNSIKDDLLYSDDSYSDDKEQQQAKSFKNQQNKQISKLNKLSISSKSNQPQRTIPNSNMSPGKSSTSNSQMNKTNKKIKKNNNDKPSDNIEINIDVVAETKLAENEPHYKSKSPPKLDISSISTSQKLTLPTPKYDENHEENDEYDEEELPNTSRSASTQNKKGKKNLNDNNKRKLERDFKSDDDLIKPKQTNSKRMTKKKKTIRRQSVKKTVNHKEEDKNIKSQNESDDSNGDLSYSEPSQNNKSKKRIIKKTTKKVIKKTPSPVQNDSENEKPSQNNLENSKTQPINKPSFRNSNSQKRSKEQSPNNNIESSDDNYQSSDEQQLKPNVPPATKVKKVTRKVVRKRVINNDKKGELSKTTNNNLNKINNDNENETNNNNKNIIKKRKVVKKKVLHKSSTNVINDNDNNSSPGILDSNDAPSTQKILAVQSIKANKDIQNNEQKDFNDNEMLPTPNPVKSRVKSKTRAKSKTINISKPQQNLLNKSDQVPLKQQQSQPQVKPQNYGEGATIASRAAWLNNELFGQQNNDDENLEELFERVVETNKAIVRNPRRGVNRRPPTILNDT